MTNRRRALAEEKKKIPDLKVVSGPEEAAEEAGLRYVSDDQPGYTRKKHGDFQFYDTSGKLIRDETKLLRIRRLAVPPAYRDVWISPSANGHIQATGRDIADENNTVITNAGAPSGMRTNTIA